MSITISKNALILSAYKNLQPLITGVLTEIGILHYTENNSLASLEELKKKLNEDNNLSFLKKDIHSFIQQNGYPFLIILDMKINTGLDSDHERVKVLKTFLLSYIIIMQSEQYKEISCNLLILADKNEYNNFKVNLKHPQNLLSILKTNDERLNNIIHEYRVNGEKFKTSFNILLTDAEQEPSLIKSELILFINLIKSKEKLKNRQVQEKPAAAAGPKIEAADAADVVLRSGTLFYKNGDAPCAYDDVLNLSDREIYILGNFTSFTRLDVLRRIISLIRTGFGNEFNIKKMDSLILNIPEESVIDSTTPITIAQLLSKELIEYKNIKIKTTPSHYEMMLQSKGFSMIQRSVIIND